MFLQINRPSAYGNPEAGLGVNSRRNGMRLAAYGPDQSRTPYIVDRFAYRNRIPCGHKPH